jgi:hypothetical protein
VNHESLSFSYQKNPQRLREVYNNFIFVFDFLKERFDQILLEPELSHQINIYKWLFIKNGLFGDLPAVFAYPKSKIIYWTFRTIFMQIKNKYLQLISKLDCKTASKLNYRDK